MGKWKEWRLIFHLPLPLAVIGLVTYGAAFSPLIHIDRLIITYLLVLFGLVLTAYPLDALYSDWSDKISRDVKIYLPMIFIIGASGFITLSIYAILKTSLTGIVVTLVLMFFLVAYNMEKPKWIHNKWGFAVSWGGFVVIASYYYQSLQLNWIMIPLFIFGMLMALTEWFTTNTKSPIQQAISQMKMDINEPDNFEYQRKTIRKQTFWITSLWCYANFFFAMTLLMWRLT